MQSNSQRIGLVMDRAGGPGAFFLFQPEPHSCSCFASSAFVLSSASRSLINLSNSSGEIFKAVLISLSLSIRAVSISFCALSLFSRNFCAVSTCRCTRLMSSASFRKACTALNCPCFAYTSASFSNCIIRSAVESESRACSFLNFSMLSYNSFSSFSSFSSSSSDSSSVFSSFFSFFSFFSGVFSFFTASGTGAGRARGSGTGAGTAGTVTGGAGAGAVTAVAGGAAAALSAAFAFFFSSFSKVDAARVASLSFFSSEEFHRAAMCCMRSVCFSSGYFALTWSATLLMNRLYALGARVFFSFLSSPSAPFLLFFFFFLPSDSSSSATTGTIVATVPSFFALRNWTTPSNVEIISS
mmetsp:Transcript_38609/g.64978  ORF Transcript_38609/g.64978 Transcript_38609/m.64978 type:complete len:355 (-) Transcript_38609:283-1347(-)